MNLKPAKSFKFLVDVNLPKKFSYFNTADFIHVVDINPRMTDNEIWTYAILNNLVLLSKDADFFNLYLIADDHPKVINFRIGNMTLSDLHQYFSKFWTKITGYLDKASFIIAQEDKIFIFP
jgi:predicted nuclease of predicted toxin-antitoxin system